MNSLRRAAATGLTVVMLVATAACSGSSGNGGGATGGGATEGGATAGSAAGYDVAEADRNGAVVVGFDMENRSLDALKATGTEDLTMLAPIYDTIVRRSADATEFEPGLAKSWKVVDPDTIELTLQEGAKFSDGTPVDAEAVRVNLLRMRDANSPEFNAVLQELNDVVVQSEQVAVLELSQPFAGEFLNVLSGPEGVMLSPKALADGVDPAQEPVGAGPYSVVSYSPDRALVLERKDDHWDADNWPVKRIEFRNVTGGNPTVAALSSGDIQLAQSDDAAIVANIGNAPGIGVRTAPGLFLDYVNFCKSRPPFDDPAVRKAFAQAIDRDALVEAATAGLGEPAYQVWREDTPNFNPEAVTPQDVDAAREALGGSTVPANMSFLPIIAGHERVAEILQANLAEVGFEVSLQPEETADEAFESSHDAVLLANSGQGAEKVRQLAPGSVSNICEFESPELKKLTDQVKSLDAASPEANQAWQDIAQLMNDETLFLPLYFRPVIITFRSDEVNAEASSLPQIDFRNIYAK